MVTGALLTRESAVVPSTGRPAVAGPAASRFDGGVATTFVFQHRWPIPAPAVSVTTALASPWAYQRWWPQIRASERVDQESGRVRVRSLLPIALTLLITRDIEDRDAGQLRVRIEGDLVGFAAWTISGDGHASLARFDQEVSVGPRLEWAAQRAPGVLRLNHGWMMRQGRRGLIRHLGAGGAEDGGE